MTPSLIAVFVPILCCIHMSGNIVDAPDDGDDPEDTGSASMRRTRLGNGKSVLGLSPRVNPKLCAGSCSVNITRHNLSVLPLGDEWSSDPPTNVHGYHTDAYRSSYGVRATKTFAPWYEEQNIRNILPSTCTTSRMFEDYFGLLGICRHSYRHRTIFTKPFLFAARSTTINIVKEFARHMGCCIKSIVVGILDAAVFTQPA